MSSALACVSLHLLPGLGNDSGFNGYIINNMIGYGTIFCKLRKCLAKYFRDKKLFSRKNCFLENFAIYKCLCSGHNNNSSEKARCGREKVFLGSRKLFYYARPIEALRWTGLIAIDENATVKPIDRVSGSIYIIMRPGERSNKTIGA